VLALQYVHGTAPASGVSVLLIGLEVFIPPASPRPSGHVVLDVVNGLEGGAWYLVRHPNGAYDLHQVAAKVPGIGARWWQRGRTCRRRSLATITSIWAATTLTVHTRTQHPGPTYQ
jgi:hypothetical protein